MRRPFWHARRFRADRPKNLLYMVATMVLLFVIFDGLIMYLAPVVMQQSGIALGTIGLILGLSSVAGLLFDVLLLRLLPDATFRLLFLIMFMAAAAVPLLLFGTNAVAVYLLAMAVWGLYYDLYEIGSLDFVEQSEGARAQVGSFGILNVFEGTGYLIAPFIASLLLVIAASAKALTGWTLAFLVTAFIMYLAVAAMKKTNGIRRPGAAKGDVLSLLKEKGLFWKTAASLLPILSLTLTINLVDSAVWTIGPVLSEGLTPGQSGGAFMVAYMIPPLLTGWFSGKLTRRLGKKRMALTALLAGSLLSALLAVLRSPAASIAVIFAVSFCWSFVWPAVSAVYSEDISDTDAPRRSVETIDDLSINLGDILGPIIIGYSAQFLGIRNAFAVTGALGALIALVLFRFAPKRLIAAPANGRP